MEDRIGFDVSASLESEDSTAVIEEIEFDIAAAADQLFLTVRVGRRQGEVLPNQSRINPQECTTNILGE